MMMKRTHKVNEMRTLNSTTVTQEYLVRRPEFHRDTVFPYTDGGLRSAKEMASKYGTCVYVTTITEEIKKLDEKR